MTEDFLNGLPAEDHEGASGHEGRPASGPRSGRRAAPLAGGITLRDTVRLLFKHKWTLFLPLIGFSLAGVLYTRQATEWYEATARIQIQPNPLSDILPGQGAIGYKNIMADQVQTLLNDGMLMRVVEELYLDDKFPSLFADNLEKGDRVSAVINFLKRRILTVQVVPDTNFLTITGEMPDKYLAYTIPNALADLYVESVRKRLAEGAQSVSGRYQKLADKTQDDLDRIEGDIEEFLDNNEIASVAGRVGALQAELNTARQLARQEETNIISLEEERIALEEELDSGSSTVQSVTRPASHPEYHELNALVDDLRLRRTTMLGLWRDDSKVIKRFDLQIAEAENQLASFEQRVASGSAENVGNPQIEQIQSDLARLRPMERAARKRFENFTQQVSDMDRELLNLSQLSRTYTKLIEEKAELRQLLSYQRSYAISAEQKNEFSDEIANVLVADRARPPVGPSSPNHFQNILLGIAAGLGIGLGISVLREIMNRSFETSEDVQKHLGLPVLGTIRDKAFRKA